MGCFSHILRGGRCTGGPSGSSGSQAACPSLGSISGVAASGQAVLPMPGAGARRSLPPILDHGHGHVTVIACSVCCLLPMFKPTVSATYIHSCWWLGVLACSSAAWPGQPSDTVEAVCLLPLPANKNAESQTHDLCNGVILCMFRALFGFRTD